jgi:hypothetical protein
MSQFDFRKSLFECRPGDRYVDDTIPKPLQRKDETGRIIQAEVEVVRTDQRVQSVDRGGYLFQISILVKTVTHTIVDDAELTHVTSSAMKKSIAYLV